MAGDLADQPRAAQAQGAAVMGGGGHRRRGGRGGGEHARRWRWGRAMMSSRRRSQSSHLQRLAVDLPAPVLAEAGERELPLDRAPVRARGGGGQARLGAGADPDRRRRSGRLRPRHAPRARRTRSWSRACAWVRSARSSAWRSRGWRATYAELLRLLEFCALTDTLVSTLTGSTTSGTSTTGSILGVKAQWSEAELHIMGSRLQGAKRHAAERGELRLPLPVGYLYDEEGNVIIDPDEEVQAAIPTCSRRSGRPARPTAWSASSAAGASPARLRRPRGRASCGGGR